MTETSWLPDEALTEADLARLPDDGHRYELVDGSLVVSPAPTIGHQRATGRLTELLRRHTPADFVVLENVAVRAGRSVLIPDITVASAEVEDGAAFESAEVALVVEVTSPSSISMDRLLKPALFAAAGIPSYWRIERDATAGVLLAVHELRGDVYTLVDEVVGDAEVVIERPFPVRIRPSSLAGPK